MKTDDLIKALAADAASVGLPIAKTIAIAVGVGALFSLAILVLALGVRPDLELVATTSLPFIFKFVVTLSVCVPAFLLVLRLAKPDFGSILSLIALTLPLAIAGTGVLVELATTPSDAWHARMMGHNSLACVTLIPFLSLAPFVGALWALKAGAPAFPSVAGAVAGLLSGGIAATLYASRCTDDSPLFVALWYPIGISLMAAAGALIGWRYLRW